MVRFLARLPLLSLLLSMLAFTLVAQEGSKGWTPELMIKGKRVGGTAISPNGKLIAYTVSVPQMEGEKSEFLTHIWVVSSDAATNSQYTYGDKSCTAPAFSPDGAMLSFLSSRGATGKNQVWVMKLSGGEAEQVTSAKTGVNAYSWSPDSKRIAFTMNDPNTDQEEKAKKEKRDMVVEDADFKYAHLYVIPVAHFEHGTRETQRLTGGNFHVVSFDWSPDSKTIVFAHQTTPQVDVWETMDISTVSSDSGAVRPLVVRNGSDASPHYSPDGKWIAFTWDGGDSRWARAYDLFLVPAAGGEPRKLASTPDRSFGIIDWSADGKTMFISEVQGTTSRVFSVPVDGSAPTVLTSGEGTFSGTSFSGDGSAMAFIFQAPELAPDIYVSPVRDFAPAKITSIHSDLPSLPMGVTEVIHWKSKDGKDIEGLLTYPVGYKKGNRYPLILNIHGGPAGVFTQGYTGGGSIYPLQAFAQQGYAILRPNPRGSSGYGAEFRRANINDWGFGDYDDDQSGVDKVIEMGVAHRDSLVVCGWSYGGYMTSFTVTKTNRFKAASVGAGVTNLMSFTGTADIPSFLPSYFGGEFWDRMETYRKHSAMFQIKGVSTPTQVIHGLSDVRVPPSQGYEFFTALKRQGCPTEMIVYPRTPHGPQEPKFIQDIGERMIAWFNKHLRGTGSVK